MPDLNSYLRNYTKAPVMYMAAFDGKQQGWPTPLGYPNPNGPFYGYDESERRTSTQMVVLTVGYAATCLIAMHTGQMANKKAIGSRRTKLTLATTGLCESKTSMANAA